MLKLIIISLFWFLFLTPFGLKSQDTISVMFYNLLKYSASDGNSGRYKDLKIIVENSKPDILLVCELSESNAAQYLLDSAMNKAGNGIYNKALFYDGTDTDNMLFYKTGVVGLKSQKQIYTVLRDISQYQIYKVLAPNDTAFIYLHAAHLKAGSMPSDENQRNSEVIAFCNGIANIPQSANVLFAGDFNLKANTEPAYNRLTSANCSHVFHDPINQEGLWNNNSAYKFIHTQSTRTNAKPGCCGGSTGGLDDRFDMILINNALRLGNTKAQYVSGSYKAYGNDGMHMNLAITDLPINSVVSATVAQALFNMSDHLPVTLKFVLKPEVIGLNENKKTNNRLKITNVFEDGVSKIKVTSQNKFNYDLIITDITGKIVLENKLNLIKNEQYIETPNNLIKNNLYTIRIKNATEQAQCLFLAN